MLYTSLLQKKHMTKHVNKTILSERQDLQEDEMQQTFFAIYKYHSFVQSVIISFVTIHQSKITLSLATTVRML